MGAVALKDIRGYSFEEGTYCAACVEAQEEAEAHETDIITTEDARENEEACFCDRCKKRIA